MASNKPAPALAKVWVSRQHCQDEDAQWSQEGDSIQVVDHRSIQLAESQAVKLQARKDLHCIEVHLDTGNATEIVHRWGGRSGGWERLDVV